MAKELRHIHFDEFAANLPHFFRLVSRGHESVVVENEEGERVVVHPAEATAPVAPPTEKEKGALHAEVPP